MKALPPPFQLVACDCIDSSNDEVRRRFDSGDAPGLVVWAKEQTAGRGRRGRTWISPRGNLHCSILLTARSPEEAPQLAFVAAAALRQGLHSLLPQLPFRCKWPNDLLVQGRKIAGMLLESAAPHVILGVGVNVVEAPDPALYPAACLRQLGSGAEDFDVLSAFCEALSKWHGIWMTQGFAPIRQAWLDHAQGVGEAVTVRLADHSELQGRFSGLDAGGALLLETEDGSVRPILAGDVFFPR